MRLKVLFDFCFAGLTVLRPSLARGLEVVMFQGASVFLSHRYAMISLNTPTHIKRWLST